MAKYIPHSTQATTSDSKAAEAHTNTFLPSALPETIQADEGRLSWRPPYLRRRTLVYFLVLFCTLLASLEAINQVSRKRRGLADTFKSRRYLWTYGPTAEHQAKENTPWINLARGSRTSTDSILLDYVSRLQPVAFVAALRKRDFLVAIAITGSVLLKIMIIFSTSLISPSLVEIHRDSVPLLLQNSFTTSDPAAALLSTGSLPYNVLTGIALSNLKYPKGTNEQYALQWFTSVVALTQPVLGATVDAFQTGLECETAEFVEFTRNTTVSYLSQLDSEPRYPYYNPKTTAPLRSSSCLIPNPSINHMGGEVSYWGIFDAARCNNSSAVADKRLLLSVGKYRNGKESPQFDPSNPAAQTATIISTLVRSTNLICRPTYSIRRVFAAINNTGLEPKFQLEHEIAAKPHSLSGLTAWDVLETSLTSMIPFQAGVGQQFAGADFMSGYPIYGNAINVTMDKGLTLGVLLQKHGKTSMDELFNQTTLLDTALRFYQAMGAQVAHKSLMMGPTNIPTTGSATTTENRLVVRAVSLRAMEALTAVIILLTVFLLLLTPRGGIAPQKPANIAVIAVILAASQPLRTLLHGTGTASLRSIKDRLRGRHYYSTIRVQELPPKFGIGMLVDKQNIDASIARETVDTEAAKSSFWQPFTTTWTSRIPSFLAILALIVALEVLLRISIRNNGLGDGSREGRVHYFWSFVPPAVMVCVGLLFASQDFAVRCMAPYAKLKSPSGASFRQSMSVNFIDQLTPITLFRAVQLRHWAVLATTLASILGSLLTIVVSGAYSLETVPQIKDIRIRETTLFSTNNLGRGAGDELDSIYIAGLIIHSNLTEPEWTYNDLALPALSIANEQHLKTPESIFESSGVPFDNLTVTMTVSAARSNFTCRSWNSDEFQTNFTWGFQQSVRGTFENLLIVTIPGEIYRPIKFGPPRWDALTNLYMGVRPDSFFGMGFTRSHLDTSTSSNYSYMWGEIGTREEGIKQISVLTCNETMESVNTTLTLTYPDFLIDTNRPPMTDESTRRVSKTYMPVAAYDFMPNISSPNSFDKFFGAVVYGKGGVPATHLGLASKEKEVAATIAHMHKIIRTQQISNFTRIPVNASTETAPFTATVLNPNRLRLLQDPLSTHLLVGLLASMLLLGLAAALLMDTKFLLSKNPCSIAAVMSLLADSEMLDDIDELRHRHAEDGVSSRQRYRMGWLDQIRDDAGSSKKTATAPDATRAQIKSRFAIGAVQPVVSNRADGKSSKLETEPKSSMEAQDQSRVSEEIAIAS